MFTIIRERLSLVGIRQAYLYSTANAARISTRVVLFTGIPDEVVQSPSFKDAFGKEAEEFWPITDIVELEDLVDERKGKALDLEGAEVKHLRKSAKNKYSRRNPHIEHGPGIRFIQGLFRKERPTHQTTPIVGEKVDTINRLREEVPDIANHVTEIRDAGDHESRRGTAVFVAFTTQAAARKAYKEVQFHSLLPTKSRFIGVQPKDVLWKNLAVQPAVRVSWASIGTAIVTLVIIFWSVISSFIGTLANIDYLTDRVHWLRFINNLPDLVLGLIKGLVPPLITSALSSYVVYFFRCM